MRSRTVRIILACLAALCLLLAAFLLFYAHLFGPAGTDTTPQAFVVSPEEPLGDIASRLKEEGLIKSTFALRLAYVRALGNEVRPGGYELSPSMDTWTVASTLTQKPYLAWVVIPPSVRKEQIAAILAADLSWTEQEKETWITTDTAPSPSYVEGVYYPDTYLIPSDQAPAQVAARLRDRFVQVFQPYADEAARQNIKWTTVLTLASLIEREAAKNDKALVAGILWNRLERGMLLQVDATLQYVKGNEEDGWWPVVHSEDKYLDSPFNTYQNAGLPPHPIAEPSLESIDAVLHPEETNCLYYLHDNNGVIHCSSNYAGQLANVNRYLK